MWINLQLNKETHSIPVHVDERSIRLPFLDSLARHIIRRVPVTITCNETVTSVLFRSLLGLEDVFSVRSFLVHHSRVSSDDDVVFLQCGVSRMFLFARAVIDEDLEWFAIGVVFYLFLPLGHQCVWADYQIPGNSATH